LRDFVLVDIVQGELVVELGSHESMFSRVAPIRQGRRITMTSGKRFIAKK